MSRTPLDRSRRQAARLALYGSLVLVAGTTFALVKLLDRPLRARATEGWVQRDYRHLPEVQMLQHYVQIDTSEETGSEVAGARFLAAQLAAAGIESQIEVLDGRHANLYAWVRGADPHPLVLHNHIDVKSVDPAQWFFPPFAGRIQLPWIYGRGVFDMKSVAIAQLMALVDLKKSGRPLRRSVLFLGTSSEEEGSALGVRWILRQHPDLVREFWAVLTEGGVVEARTRDDIKYWGTEVAQKHFADLWVCSGEREPLEKLRQELHERGYTETDLRLVDEARQHFAHYGPTRDSKDLRDLLVHPERVLGDIAAFRRLPPYLRSMLRNEAVPFEVEEAPGGGYRLLVKFHLLPGQELADVRRQLLPDGMTFGLQTVLAEAPAARHGSPVGHPAFQGILATLKEKYPDAPAGPFFLPWTATDARFFRAAGIPSYGFSPFLIMSTDTLQVDAPNERLALPGFVEGVDVYRALLRRLVSDS
jgi:acetylornithine deacetylase/succinyl-diaminopimelate desuccinylase-like protein